MDGVYGPLYSYGVKVLKLYRPQWFLAENVGGLKNANDGKAFTKILEEMRSAGYKLYPNLYKFETYGIPQARHRIIIVGIRNDLDFEFKIPSNAPYKDVDNSCKTAIEVPPIPADAENNELTKQSTASFFRSMASTWCQILYKSHKTLKIIFGRLYARECHLDRGTLPQSRLAACQPPQRGAKAQFQTLIRITDSPSADGFCLTYSRNALIILSMTHPFPLFFFLLPQKESAYCQHCAFCKGFQQSGSKHRDHFPVVWQRTTVSAIVMIARVATKPTVNHISSVIVPSPLLFDKMYSASYPTAALLPQR